MFSICQFKNKFGSFYYWLKVLLYSYFLSKNTLKVTTNEMNLTTKYMLKLVYNISVVKKNVRGLQPRIPLPEEGEPPSLTPPRDPLTNAFWIRLHPRYKFLVTPLCIYFLLFMYFCIVAKLSCIYTNLVYSQVLLSRIDSG